MFLLSSLMVLTNLDPIVMSLSLLGMYFRGCRRKDLSLFKPLRLGFETLIVVLFASIWFVCGMYVTSTLLPLLVVLLWN
jgi:hypothetical protein